MTRDTLFRCRETPHSDVLNQHTTGGSETPFLTCIFAGFLAPGPELHGGRVTSGSPVRHQSWVIGQPARLGGIVSASLVN